MCHCVVRFWSHAPKCLKSEAQADFLAAQPLPQGLQHANLVGDAVDPKPILTVGLDHGIAPQAGDDAVERHVLAIAEVPHLAVREALERCLPFLDEIAQRLLAGDREHHLAHDAIRLGQRGEACSTFGTMRR
jgi:hypothetical protein